MGNHPLLGIFECYRFGCGPPKKNDLQGSVKRFQFEIDLMGSCVKNEKLGCFSISILKTIGSWLTCFRKCKSMQKKLKEQIFIKTIYVKNSQKLF